MQDGTKLVEADPVWAGIEHMNDIKKKIIEIWV